MSARIHGVCALEVIGEPDPETGKPYLQLAFGNGEPLLFVTLNLGELIGGAAKGARERFELIAAGKDPIEDFMQRKAALENQAVVLTWLTRLANLTEMKDLNVLETRRMAKAAIDLIAALGV